MNKSNLKILAGTTIALIAVLLALQFGNGDSSLNDGLLLQDLRDRINDVTTLTITRAGDEGATVIHRTADNWVIASRDNYPVDIATLRQLLLQIADAKMVEQKTSDPDLYSQLGVQDPAIEGSKGTRLQLSGPDVSYDVIVGNVAQPGYRYVRKFEDSRSWLIDKDPGIPGSPAEWLVSDIIDIKSADVRSVTIRHPDGEEIRISKDSADAPEFAVVNIPDGRELSYATVANGIAGALNALTLDDVRKGVAIEAEAVSTTFDTIDGNRIVVLTNEEDGESWIALTAAPGDDTDTDAASLNERVQGWQFRIADYKANQLTRRWEDILKAETE